MEQILKDNNGHIIGRIRDCGSRQEIYDGNHHKLGYFDGKYTFDGNGHRIGQGNLLATLLRR